MLKKTLLLFLVFLMTFPYLTFAKKNKIGKNLNVVIIVNSKVKEDLITKKELQKILFGKKKKWKDNTNIILALPENEEILKPVLKTVKKSLSQFENNWKKLIFTGKRKAPIKLKTQEEIIAFVKQTPGALSIVLKNNTLGNEIKILKIKEK